VEVPALPGGGDAGGRGEGEKSCWDPLTRVVVRKHLAYSRAGREAQRTERERGASEPVAAET
jgi:hypothetical protein